MQELHAGVISPKLAYEKLLQQISNGLLHPTCKPKSFEQFDNHFRYKKTQLNGGSGPITVRDIEMMARDHAEIPPETDMDKAYVITNAAKLVYPRAKRCMCWFHVKKNVEDALQRLV
ncbi:hypothetical protein FOL46_002857, partial [Perkinsus olseni]